jgi:hypothetical protein
MNGISVTVAEAMVFADVFTADGTYAFSDATENIKALPALDIIAPLTKIQSTAIDAALVLNLDQAAAHRQTRANRRQPRPELPIRSPGAMTS